MNVSNIIRLAIHLLVERDVANPIDSRTNSTQFLYKIDYYVMGKLSITSLYKRKTEWTDGQHEHLSVA